MTWLTVRFEVPDRLANEAIESLGRRVKEFGGGGFEVVFAPVPGDGCPECEHYRGLHVPGDEEGYVYHCSVRGCRCRVTRPQLGLPEPSMRDPAYSPAATDGPPEQSEQRLSDEDEAAFSQRKARLEAERRQRDLADETDDVAALRRASAVWEGTD